MRLPLVTGSVDTDRCSASWKTLTKEGLCHATLNERGRISFTSNLVVWGAFGTLSKEQTIRSFDSSVRTSSLPSRT